MWSKHIIFLLCSCRTRRMETETKRHPVGVQAGGKCPILHQYHYIICFECLRILRTPDTQRVEIRTCSCWEIFSLGLCIFALFAGGVLSAFAPAVFLAMCTLWTAPEARASLFPRVQRADVLAVHSTKPFRIPKLRVSLFSGTYSACTYHLALCSSPCGN